MSSSHFCSSTTPACTLQQRSPQKLLITFNRSISWPFCLSVFVDAWAEIRLFPCFVKCWYTSLGFKLSSDVFSFPEFKIYTNCLCWQGDTLFASYKLFIFWIFLLLCLCSIYFVYAVCLYSMPYFLEQASLVLILFWSFKIWPLLEVVTL